MKTIHARIIGNNALLPSDEFEQLLKIAQKNERIELEIRDNDITTLEIMQLIEQSGSFDFWKEKGEEIYSLEDGEAI
jgi:hypothetical protein